MVGIDIIMALLGLILTGIFTFLIFIYKEAVSYKKESNNWKEEHNERLTKVETKIEILIDKTKSGE